MGVCASALSDLVPEPIRDILAIEDRSLARYTVRRPHEDAPRDTLAWQITRSLRSVDSLPPVKLLLERLRVASDPELVEVFLQDLWAWSIEPQTCNEFRELGGLEFMRELVLHKDLQEDELVMRAAIRLLREHAENTKSAARMSALDFKSVFETAVLPRFTYLEDLVVSAYHFFEQMRLSLIEHAKDVVDESGARANLGDLLSIVGRHVLEHAIAHHAIAALDRVLRTADVSLETLPADELELEARLGQLVVAIRTHGRSIPTLQRGLNVLINLIRHSPSLRESLGRAGAVDAFVGLVDELGQTSAGGEAVQFGLHALSVLLQDSDANQLRFLRTSPRTGPSVIKLVGERVAEGAYGRPMLVPLKLLLLAREGASMLQTRHEELIAEKRYLAWENEHYGVRVPTEMNLTRMRRVLFEADAVREEEERRARAAIDLQALWLASRETANASPTPSARTGTAREGGDLHQSRAAAGSAPGARAPSAVTAAGALLR